MGSIKDENYIHIPGWVLTRTDLDIVNAALYSIIYGYTQNTEEHKYSGGLTYLSSFMKLDKANISKRLKVLSERGLIIRMTKNVNGVMFCEYRAIVPPAKGCCNSATGVADAQQGCCGSATNNNINNNIKEVSKDKSLDTKKEREAEFDIFWKAYPRKESKKDALKAFLKTKVPLSTLLTAIEQQKKTEQWSGSKKFIPLPASWLNGERWEDEIDPNSLVQAPAPVKHRVIKTRINEYGEEEAYYDEP